MLMATCRKAQLSKCFHFIFFRVELSTDLYPFVPEFFICFFSVILYYHEPYNDVLIDHMDPIILPRISTLYEVLGTT